MGNLEKNEQVIWAIVPLVQNQILSRLDFYYLFVTKNSYQYISNVKK